MSRGNGGKEDRKDGRPAAISLHSHPGWRPPASPPADRRRSCSCATRFTTSKKPGFPIAAARVGQACHQVGRVVRPPRQEFPDVPADRMAISISQAPRLGLLRPLRLWIKNLVLSSLGIDVNFIDYRTDMVALIGKMDIDYAPRFISRSRRDRRYSTIIAHP